MDDKSLTIVSFHSAFRLTLPPLGKQGSDPTQQAHGQFPEHQLAAGHYCCDKKDYLGNGGAADYRIADRNNCLRRHLQAL